MTIGLAIEYLIFLQLQQLDFKRTIKETFFIFYLKGGKYKTNTVLQYEENLTDVKLWGFPALSKRPNRTFDRNKKECVVELFKMQLGNLSKELKRKFEPSVNYKKAITDYLQKMGDVSVTIVFGVILFQIF